MEENNLRLVDFFNQFDEDHSMSVTRDEFKKGVEVSLLIYLHILVKNENYFCPN